MIRFLSLCLFIIFISLLSMSQGFIGALASAFLPIISGLGAAIMIIQVLSMPLQNRRGQNLAIDPEDNQAPIGYNIFAAMMGFMQGLLFYTFQVFHAFYVLLGRLVGWAAPPALGRAAPVPPVVIAPEVVWPQERQERPPAPLPPAAPLLQPAPPAPLPAAGEAPPDNPPLPQSPFPDGPIHIHIHIPIHQLSRHRGRGRGRGRARAARQGQA